MGTCPECLHDSQTGSGLATMSASSSVLMDASCQVSRASLISVNVPELLPLPLGSLHCSGLPCNLRSLAFLNASLCGRGWGNVLLTLPFVTRPLATFGSLVSGSCRSYPILERCYFCVKKRLWVFFFYCWYFRLLASVEAMSEFQVLGVVADSCTSWCIRNWVALCILSISEQLNKGYGWFLGVFDSCFTLSPSFLFVPP